MRKIRPGVYRHYKGREYDVYGEAVLSGTEDSGQILAVIYRPRYGQRRLTYRPKVEFLEEIPSAFTSDQGASVSRFVFVRDFDDACLVGIAAFFSS